MINSGDTAFVLCSAALVLLMIPGLALFYGGMVRKKNVLGTIMQSFILIALVTFEWVYLGYSMSFGPDIGNGLLGSLAWAGLGGVGAAPNTDYAGTIPHIAFAMYQCMFAAITPALITGAVAERMRFGPFLLFSLAWVIVVYNPVCHWVWGNGGWLKSMGVLDFAGGIVVHLTCGAAALAAVLVTGPRKDHGKHQIMPHNLPMTLLGTGLLWFGWVGHRMVAPGQAHHPGRGFGCRGRSGHHYSWRWLCLARLGRADRHAGRHGVLRGRAVQGPAALR
jgi:Amt family ammonium transporter